MSMAKKRMFGLTGGVACGKETVASMFREVGVGVLDADQLAEEVVAPGKRGLQALVEAFGAGILSDAGALDSKRLHELVTGDAAALSTLDSIINLEVAAAALVPSLQLHGSDAPYLLYKAGVLIQQRGRWNLPGLRTIAVAVPRDVQVTRLMARDGISKAAADECIARNLADVGKGGRADWVIDNSGTLEETRACVESLHAELLALVAASEGAR